MLSINTNLSALIIQKSLKTSTQKLNTAVERMSTGFKINHAKDNAAGYSIITDMNTKIGAYQIAEENTAMSLDLITTASESLDLISNNLTQLRTLAEQSLNGTYSQNSQASINKEANALVDEIERVYSTTEYNGIKPFGSSGGNFIEKVTPRDTSSMTKLSTIDPTTTISSGTYSISTAEELAQLATMTNSGKVTGGEFVLANNIDLSAYSSGEGWVPIGNATKAFSGLFDGNGYVVKNLYINRPDSDYQGLFGNFSSNMLQNLGVENVNITGKSYTGALAGLVNSHGFKNCYSAGKIKGVIYVGGLFGEVGDAIGDEPRTLKQNFYSNCEVQGNYYVGGLIGATSYGLLSASYATGNVTAGRSGGGLIGGLKKTCSIEDCFATGNVNASSSRGGLVGAGGAGSFSNSYYNSETSGCSDTGKGVGVTTTELNQLLTNGTLPDFTLKTACTSNIANFQVGINTNSSSKISLDTAIGLNIASLRSLGLNSTNHLEQVDNIINKISEKQTLYGATQNRLLSALDEISTQYENLVSSRSTIRDTDISKTSAEYIKQQILQQASAALLATANQSPALALQLI